MKTTPVTENGVPHFDDQADIGLVHKAIEKLARQVVDHGHRIADLKRISIGRYHNSQSGPHYHASGQVTVRFHAIAGHVLPESRV